MLFYPFCCVAGEKNQESCWFPFIIEPQIAFKVVSFHHMAVLQGFKTIYNSDVHIYGEPDVKVMHNMYLHLHIFMNLR